MNNKGKKYLTFIVTMLTICMMSITAFAASTNVFNKEYYIPAQQIWTASAPVDRSVNYSYVSASLSTVYPLHGSDNFKKIQARIVTLTDKPVCIMTSSYEVLTEGDGYFKLKIMEGYLSLKTVWIQFRGNSDSAAYAVVNYKGN